MHRTHGLTHIGLIKPSPISSFFKKIHEAKGLVNLTYGEPDFNTPESIKREAVKALKNDYTHYAEHEGLTELREAIAHKYQNESKSSFEDQDVCVTTGSSGALFNTMLALLRKGDEVIIIDPFYVFYLSIAKLFHGRVKTITPSFENNFKPTPEELDKAISKKTRLLVINSPNNPTGGVYSREFLEYAAETAQRKKFFVLQDEVYEKIVRGKHYSLASQADNPFVLVTNSFSKSYAMTGWRVGWIAGKDKQAMRSIKLAQTFSNLAVNTFAQKAALKALQLKAEVNKMKKEYFRRMDYAYSRLKKMGFELHKPEGAFYLFPSSERITPYCVDMSYALLEHARVAVIPGSAFGKNGEKHFRISCATSMENIREGMDRIEDALPIVERTCSIKRFGEIDYFGAF